MGRARNPRGVRIRTRAGGRRTLAVYRRAVESDPEQAEIIRDDLTSLEAAFPSARDALRHALSELGAALE